MTLKRRLKILYAAFTQQWHTFRCGCGTEVWVSDGAGKLLDGQQCDACEAKAFDAWERDFSARHAHGKGAA